MVRDRAARQFRRWLPAVAALATHGAVLWALPDAAGKRASDPQTVSFTLVESAVFPSFVPDSGSAPAAPRASAKPLRKRVASKPTSAPPVASAAPAAEAPGLTVASAESANAEGVANGDGQENGISLGHGKGAGVEGEGVGVTRPSLMVTRDPCLGYFPASAQVDHGRVQIQVRVDAAGHVSVSDVMVEAPLGNDFGRAARACAAALRFQPARDAKGLAVAGDAKLELHFHRS